jgi:hypothetical protein
MSEKVGIPVSFRTWKVLTSGLSGNHPVRGDLFCMLDPVCRTVGIRPYEQNPLIVAIAHRVYGSPLWGSVRPWQSSSS